MNIPDGLIRWVLKAWKVPHNAHRAKQVGNNDEYTSQTETFGLMYAYGRMQVSHTTKDYLNIAKIVNTWIRGRLPAELQGWHWSSFVINRNLTCSWHTDSNMSPALSTSMGEYSGGEVIISKAVTGRNAGETWVGFSLM